MTGTMAFYKFAKKGKSAVRYNNKGKGKGVTMMMMMMTTKSKASKRPMDIFQRPRYSRPATTTRTNAPTHAPTEGRVTDDVPSLGNDDGGDDYYTGGGDDYYYYGDDDYYYYDDNAYSGLYQVSIQYSYQCFHEGFTSCELPSVDDTSIPIPVGGSFFPGNLVVTLESINVNNNLAHVTIWDAADGTAETPFPTGCRNIPDQSCCVRGLEYDHYVPLNREASLTIVACDIFGSDDYYADESWAYIGDPVITVFEVSNN